MAMLVQALKRNFWDRVDKQKRQVAATLIVGSAPWFPLPLAAVGAVVGSAAAIDAAGFLFKKTAQGTNAAARSIGSVYTRRQQAKAARQRQRQQEQDQLAEQQRLAREEAERPLRQQRAMDEAQRRYEQTLRRLAALGLQGSELSGASEMARQQFLRDIDEALRS
jgi:hypothetical protein